jgi:hypothetical protein
MTSFQTLRISKIDYKLNFINNEPNFLYCLEYFDINKFTIDEIVNKYKKNYSCEIELC